MGRFNVPREICAAVEFHDSLDTELPIENDNYLQQIARQATAIVGQFSLPKEIATMDLYHMLRATVEQGKKHYREQVRTRLRSKGYQEIFPSLLEKAADLVANDLKAHLRQRAPEVEFATEEACADDEG